MFGIFIAKTSYIGPTIILSLFNNIELIIAGGPMFRAIEFVIGKYQPLGIPVTIGPVGISCNWVISRYTAIKIESENFPIG